jgi:transcriptional regulator with XRE-family HTH domain
MSSAHAVGERIAYHRRRAGLSQTDFAGLVGRSESWVSQVERGVRAVDRLSVLQRVADALSVSVSELRDEDETAASGDRPEAFDTIRLALTGHPAMTTLLRAKPPAAATSIAKLRAQHSQVWDMVHASRYTDLAPVLADLIPGLEAASRASTGSAQTEARELLTDTYQATAAMLAKIGEADAAWIAADRATACAELTGSPLAVAAGIFRMAHVFLALGHGDQANHVALSAVEALEPRVTPKADPELLSLYGAFHLVLAVTSARDNDRAAAHRYLDTARGIAERIGGDRNDFGTEFGPTNVAIHSVAIAVELGDAGQAIELGDQVDPTSLSPERQSRFMLDLAQAHAMRRQAGEALKALIDAEQIAPEQTRTHPLGRAVARDLLQLAGSRPRPELRDLAERFDVS